MVSRLAPLAAFPQLGEPSEPSLAAQTAEPPSGPYCSNPAPEHHAGPTVASPEPPRSTSDPGSEVLRGGSGEGPGRLRRGYADMSGRRGRYPTHFTENTEPDSHHK